MYVRRDSTQNSGVRAEGGLCPHQMFLENHARADERQDEGATQILHDVHANLKELDKRHAERTGVRWPECPRPVRLSRFSAGGRHPRIFNPRPTKIGNRHPGELAKLYQIR